MRRGTGSSRTFLLGTPLTGDRGGAQQDNRYSFKQARQESLSAAPVRARAPIRAGMEKPTRTGRLLQARQESNLQPPVLESSAPHGHADTPEHNGAQNQAAAQACLVVLRRTAQVFWTQFGPKRFSFSLKESLTDRLIACY